VSGSFGDWKREVKSAGTSLRTGDLHRHQRELFPVRISTILPAYTIGKDLAFLCVGDDGSLYYAKRDKDGRCIRATEWIATNLAHALGISVADPVVLENADGETFFGSRQPASLADDIRCERFLRSPARDETGRTSAWLGQYLARLWAFDTFIDNPDRLLRNFVLDGQSGRVRAIDFASARLIQNPDAKFPIATDNTVVVGRIVRSTHGAHRESAFELLDWLGSMATETIMGIVTAMPEGWLSDDQLGGFVAAWSGERRRERTASVRALIEHDW
jgi:hypothetical protein